jgi:diguanylate cyclase (GGDEF)-like protein
MLKSRKAIMGAPLKFTGCRVERTEVPCTQVPVVQVGMPLVDLAQIFASHDSRHVLVQDKDELVGIVSINDLQQAIRSFSDEATAWHHRVVESLVVVHLNEQERSLRSGHGLVENVETAHAPLGDSSQQDSTDAPKTVETTDTQIEQLGDCISVTEGSDLIALLTNEDVLLSWNRLEPSLARAALDTLTQLPNRAHFERRFREEWERAARMKTSLGLLIIDVDEFKSINDEFGHLRGDMVLAAVAQCCQRQLRSYDLVARFAGDEFIAITCGCTLAAIENPIRRLQQATREMNLKFNEQEVSVSLSIGAAVIELPTGSDPTPLFEAADHCLYSAKRDGRARAYRTQLESDGSFTQETLLVDVET